MLALKASPEILNRLMVSRLAATLLFWSSFTLCEAYATPPKDLNRVTALLVHDEFADG